MTLWARILHQASCFICLRNSIIIPIFHSIWDCAGYQIIWSCGSCCLHRQQLLCGCNFYFCSVIVVGNRLLQIFTRMTSLSVFFRPRFKYFYAINCTVSLVHLFLFWKHYMSIVSVYSLMRWCLMFLFIAIPIISNTTGADGYICVIGWYETNSF